jgi:hypothetical protein
MQGECLRSAPFVGQRAGRDIDDHITEMDQLSIVRQPSHGCRAETELFRDSAAERIGGIGVVQVDVVRHLENPFGDTDARADGRGRYWYQSGSWAAMASDHDFLFSPLFYRRHQTRQRGLGSPDIEGWHGDVTSGSGPVEFGQMQA